MSKLFISTKNTIINEQAFFMYIIETEAIILSSFPKPVLGTFGHIYEIPWVHCVMKECQIDDGLTNGSTETKTYCNRGTNYQRWFCSYVLKII